VEAALRSARPGGPGFAILVLDLDRFKIINDSLGHAFGDRVLRIVAARLQICLRQTDMLCRLGGDEFAAYVHASDTTTAENVARRMLQEMLQPFSLDAMSFSIQCSIGVALYPQDGASLDELIKQADSAMYRVKERGRGNYGFYQPQMNANLLTRMKLEHAMRQALGFPWMDSLTLDVALQELERCVERGRGGQFGSVIWSRGGTRPTSIVMPLGRAYRCGHGRWRSSSSRI